MPETTVLSPLDSVAYALDPRSIAIIGASEHVNKVGGRPISYLQRFGFAGRIYPINPNRESVQGLRAYSDLAGLPEVPDLAIVATPAQSVMSAVDACAARGVKVAIVMASGFGETVHEESMRAERELVARARAAGMRIVGPNCQGLANFATGTIASFSTILGETEPADGPIAIVSQSGVMSAVPYGLLRARGIGVRHAHSTGNDADVTLSEMAAAVIRDPAVRLLLLYIESIRDPDMLALAARLARERDVPVIAVKSGRTSRGQAAARSHTGALATEDRVVDAFFRKHGIWRARDVHELIGGAELYLKGWRPRGRGLVAISNSGATCVMAADLAAEVNLDLPTLAPETTRRLASTLPSFATITNPIDVTAALLADSTLFGNVLSTVGGDPAADLLFVGMSVAGEGYDVESFVRDAAAFASRSDKPIVVAAPQEGVAARFRSAGIPTFANQTEAIRLLAQLVDHSDEMRRPLGRSPEPIDVQLPSGGTRFLSEFESLAFLRRYGLPTVPSRLCRSAEDARAAATALGMPVVLKACSAALPHKSDQGLVMVGLDSDAAVTRAFGDLTGRLRRLDVSADILVAPMVRGRRELMIGARVDPTFGPVVIIGDGGKYVEALGDFTVLVTPFDVEDVRRVLLKLRIAPILQGVRGEPPLDLEPLCQAAVRLGQIIAAAASEIASIDINPIIIAPAGEPLVIVDALVERAMLADLA